MLTVLYMPATPVLLWLTLRTSDQRCCLSVSSALHNQGICLQQKWFKISFIALKSCLLFLYRRPAAIYVAHIQALQTKLLLLAFCCLLSPGQLIEQGNRNNLPFNFSSYVARMPMEAAMHLLHQVGTQRWIHVGSCSTTSCPSSSFLLWFELAGFSVDMHVGLLC